MSTSTLVARVGRWRPGPVGLRRAFWAALVANAAIVVTGASVRLTASGLGCPTVPRCTDTSMVPTREMGVHGLIEFSNRMLTFVVSATVLIAIVVARRARRRDLFGRALLLLAGIAAQAFLGAVTVRTGLNPATVMAHFLVSMVLIAVAVDAYELSAGRRTPTQPRVRRDIQLGVVLLLGVVAMTLFLGTVVTGTGPHSGDKNATHRLPFDLADVTHLHADLVFVLLGLAVGLIVALRATAAPPDVVRRAVAVLVIALAQGVVGFTQYLTDLPVVLVGLHVLGATLVWITTLRLLTGTVTRVADDDGATANVPRGGDVGAPRVAEKA